MVHRRQTRDRHPRRNLDVAIASRGPPAPRGAPSPAFTACSVHKCDRSRSLRASREWRTARRAPLYSCLRKWLRGSRGGRAAIHGRHFGGRVGEERDPERPNRDLRTSQCDGLTRCRRAASSDDAEMIGRSACMHASRRQARLPKGRLSAPEGSAVTASTAATSRCSGREGAGAVLRPR
jgi:hypothetical protein